VKVFRAIIQHSSELVVIVDETGVLQYVSPSAQPLLGYRPEDVEGSSAFDLVHPDELEVLHKRFEDALETPGIGVPFELLLRAADGRWVTYELLASNMFHDPDVRGMVFHGRDVSERKRMAQALHAAHQQFQAVYEHAPFSITLLDFDGRILDINYSGCALLGRTRTELLGTSAREVVHPDDFEHVADAFRRQLSGAETSVEFRLLRPDGTQVWVLSRASLIDTGGETDPYLVTIQTDITDRRLLEQRLELEATRDPLTGIYNRGAFMTQLELRFAHQTGGDAAVLFVDLDYFKTVNDTLGHDAGDIVLATLARRIQEVVREGDVVARLGGDEFVVLCDTVTIPEARDIAARIRTACRTPIHLRGSEVTIDASVGIAIANAADEPASLLRRADTAVYAAKHAGRGRVALDHNDAAASSLRPGHRRLVS
jgi:diguanylate cyclase (GGDEF)-like protein/PAS domain S-box-containing protein